MLLTKGFCNLAGTNTELGRRGPLFELLINDADIQKCVCGTGSTFLGEMV
jgi:hypothetical protein